jgi:hypothetical protein
VGTTGVHDHPPPTLPGAARGEYAGPPQAPQNGHAGQWIVVGPRTRAHAARVLEQSLAPVWVALLETSGVPEGQGWRLVVEAAHLEPEPVQKA